MTQINIPLDIDSLEITAQNIDKKGLVKNICGRYLVSEAFQACDIALF